MSLLLICILNQSELEVICSGLNRYFYDMYETNFTHSEYFDVALILILILDRNLFCLMLV